jgi:hypothetical protein
MAKVIKDPLKDMFVVLLKSDATELLSASGDDTMFLPDDNDVMDLGAITIGSKDKIQNRLEELKKAELALDDVPSFFNGAKVVPASKFFAMSYSIGEAPKFGLIQDVMKKQDATSLKSALKDKANHIKNSIAVFKTGKKTGLADANTKIKNLLAEYKQVKKQADESVKALNKSIAFEEQSLLKLQEKWGS